MTYQHTTKHHQNVVLVCQRILVRVHYTVTKQQPTGPPAGGRAGRKDDDDAPRDRGAPQGCYGGHSVGETPGPIPNPEAKTHCADGTALDRVWESRTPPDSLWVAPPVHDPDKGSRTGGPHPFKPLAHPRPTGALGTQWKHKMSQRRVGRISESLTPCRQSHTSVMVEPCRGLAF